MKPSPTEHEPPPSAEATPKAEATPNAEATAKAEATQPDGEKRPTDVALPTHTAHAALRYSTFRLAIFVVVLVLLWLVRVRGVLLVALALIVSGLASYALLRGQRDAMSMQLATATQRRRQRSAARAAREDAAADALIESRADRDR